MAMDASGVSAAIWLLAGLAGGIAHFSLLRWNTALYAEGSVVGALGVQLLRMALTTGLLVFAVSHGASPLLLAALGVVLARLPVLRVSMATTP
jgi:F1F0 ATPase subunit 2